MQWLVDQGASVAIPIGHSPHWDLVADLDGNVLRVQVKTSAYWRNGRWEIAVCTKGGNQSWNGLVKQLDSARYDYLFVHVADGRRWFIPSSEVGGRNAIRLGGPKYASFEIDGGPPLLGPVAGRKANAASTIADAVWGDARVVKGTRL
jgi:PD-(D/E)XK endonuclease